VVFTLVSVGWFQFSIPTGEFNLIRKIRMSQYKFRNINHDWLQTRWRGEPVRANCLSFGGVTGIFSRNNFVRIRGIRVEAI
jgi:hypothetical protein